MRATRAAGAKQAGVERGTVEWAVRAVGPSQREAGGAGPSWDGPRDATGLRKGKTRAGFWRGFWAGSGFPFLFYFFPPSFLFLIQTKFEFKYKFEFKPHSNKKICTSMNATQIF